MLDVLIVLAERIPLLIDIPEIAVAEVTYKLPPIPTPPVTIKAPVVVDLDVVVDVTANPDIDNISVEGL